jgi:nucleotide-binding universal stress UspA family protein
MNLGDLLFATDFSAASEPAGRVAKEMARQWEGRLHIVYVVPPATDPADSAEKLTRLAAGLGEGLRAESALLSGRVAHQIVRYAKDKGIGLIVLGTHGRTGVSRALLGSVAESVVRLAPCPVLTVPLAVVGAGAPKAGAAEAPPSHHCVVCGHEAEDLICETCRIRIRAEALERKIEAERPGGRGSPA